MQKTNGQFLHDVALQVTLGSQYQAASSLPEPLAQFLHSLPEAATTDKTHTTLQLLTALELYRRAGYQPGQLADPERLHATQDTVRPVVINQAVQQLFQQVQEPGCHGFSLLLWTWWLQLATHNNATLPYALLPEFLTVFTALTALQPVALKLLNGRGRWLAGQQAVWRWATLPPQFPATSDTADSDPSVASGLSASATSQIQEIWTGLADKEQLLLFRVYRQQQPVQASMFLQQQWPVLAADQREKLLALLALQLEPADMAFLEQVLAEDRSAYVRQQAALLLARLPHSTTFHTLQQLFVQAVSLDAQQQLQFVQQDALWQQCQQAGIDHKTMSIYWRQSDFKRAGLGQQGLGIHLLCSLFPLACWQALYADPVQCLAAIEKSIWREAMLLGLMHACISQQNRVWADVLIIHASAFVLQPECLYEQGELMKLASPAQRDQLLLGQVDAMASHYAAEQLQKSWNDVFASLGQHAQDVLLDDETASQLMARAEKQRQQHALWLKDTLLLLAPLPWLEHNLSRFDASRLGLFRLRSALIAPAGQP